MVVHAEKGGKRMFNFEKIRTATDKELALFFKKADVTRGSRGRKLRKIAEWMLEEVY